jgi:outer membrane lipoprotein carrier protein
MELKDTFGQTSLITLSKIERNPSLKADQFKFVVPKGADIFRQ